MPENTAFLVINTIPNPENMEGFRLYLSKIIPIFQQYGGKIVGRYKTVEQVMGKDGPKASAIVAFSSAKIVKEMLAGEAFNSLNQLRKEAYHKVDLMLCESL